MSILGDFFIRYLFVLVLFYSLISGADTRRSFARAETYFKGGRYKRSISILKSIYSSRNISITDKVKAAVMISKSYRKEEKPEKAFEILKEVSMGREGEYWLEYSEVCLEVKDLEGALRGTNWFSSQSRKDYVLKSDWVRARAESANEDYYRSMLSCKALLKDVPAYYSGRSDFDRDAIKSWLGKIKELYKLAREKYELKRYGQDYLYYRKGREAEFDGEFQDAITLYSMIKGGTLKRAGWCYTGHCLRKLGSYKSALKYYEKLLEGNILGLYRGEAMYFSAVIEYLQLDNKTAKKISKRLVRWFSELQDKKEKIVLEGINDALKSDIILTAPREFLRTDDCGNLIRNQDSPEAIINRLTTPWYFSVLRTRGELLYAFFKSEAIGKGRKIPL